GHRLPTVRSLHRPHGALRTRLMLGVRSLAVLGEHRISIAPIGVGTLMCGAIGACGWVISLTDFLVAVGGRGGCPARISPGGWVIPGAIVRGAVSSVSAH